MDTYTFLTAVVIMLSLGAILATFLAVANKKLYVYEDPRIDNVEEMLPGSNCGACGQPGCRAFAEQVVDGNKTPAECTVSDENQRQSIADYLGVDAGSAVRRIARLACAGGTNVARQRAEYKGLESCRAADLVTGGGKGCSWGCLGHGDCADVCGFGAIKMSETGLPIVDADLCTACGDCVDICPKDLFSIELAANNIWVACKSLANGDDALDECAVACTACGKCAADAPGSLITMANNLPVVDYSQVENASKDIIDRCPTGAIVWIDELQNVHKGKEAPVITRISALPIG